MTMTSTRSRIAATLVAASLRVGLGRPGLAQDKPKDDVSKRCSKSSTILPKMSPDEAKEPDPKL